MKQWRTVLVGAGVRGSTHLKGVLENKDRYQVAGLCDLNIKKTNILKEKYKLSVPVYEDAETMLRECKPEVLIFVTHPDVRLEMVKLAAKYQVQAVSMEKPMAQSLAEACEIKKICEENHMKAVVCHQQKYLKQMQEMKRRIVAGEIGEIKKIHVETQPWMAQLGTHYVDYALWAAGGQRAKWVIGHAHGRAELGDSHPSPDFLEGEMLLENGVRVYLECGYLSESHHPEEYADIDNRITVYGTRGYVWAETDGYWGAFTSQTQGELLTGKEPGWYHHQEKQIQTPYYTEFADWLDDDKKIHSCNVEISYHGYEILEGMCLSALNHVRVDFPIAKLDYEPVLTRMKKEFPDIGTKPRILYDGKESREEYD